MSPPGTSTRSVCVCVGNGRSRVNLLLFVKQPCPSCYCAVCLIPTHRKGSGASACRVCLPWAPVEPRPGQPGPSSGKRSYGLSTGTARRHVADAGCHSPPGACCRSQCVRLLSQGSRLEWIRWVCISHPQSRSRIHCPEDYPWAWSLLVQLSPSPHPTRSVFPPILRVSLSHPSLGSSRSSVEPRPRGAVVGRSTPTRCGPSRPQAVSLGRG